MEHAKEKGIGRLLIRGDRAVNFRPVLLFAAAFALGIFAAFRFGTAVLWCGLLFVPVAGGALLFGHCKHRTVIGFVLYAVLFCALFCAGALAFAVRIGAARNFPCVLLTAVSEDVIARAYRALVLNPDNEGQAMPVILQKPANAEALASALRRAVAENRKTTD